MSTFAEPELPEFLGGAAETAPAPVSARLRPSQRSQPAGAHIPGEAGVWIFILGDMTLFGAIMLVLLHEHGRRPGPVAAAAGQLEPDLGAINTVVLLVSSYLVVRALYAQRDDDATAVRRALAGAQACAAAFVVIKLAEYLHEIGIGNTPASGIFFTYYFALTALHLLHVLVGVGLLTAWRSMAGRGRRWESGRVTFEAVAVYWHMVDLLWIAIFTLVYLVCAQ